LAELIKPECSSPTKLVTIAESLSEGYGTLRGGKEGKDLAYFLQEMSSRPWGREKRVERPTGLRRSNRSKCQFMVGKKENFPKRRKKK